MARIQIPVDILTSRLGERFNSVRTTSLGTRFANLRPLSEFFDIKRMSKPQNFGEMQSRVNYNIGYFSSNYAIVFFMLCVYSLLTNWWLLFDIIFVIASMFAIGKLNGRDLEIGNFRATTSQLYTGVYVIAIPVFFISSFFTTIAWLIGASGVFIIGHASFMDKPIDEAFFWGGGLGGRPRAPKYSPSWGRPSKRASRSGYNSYTHTNNNINNRDSFFYNNQGWDSSGIGRDIGGGVGGRGDRVEELDSSNSSGSGSSGDGADLSAAGWGSAHQYYHLQHQNNIRGSNSNMRKRGKYIGSDDDLDSDDDRHHHHRRDGSSGRSSSSSSSSSAETEERTDDGLSDVSEPSGEERLVLASAIARIRKSQAKNKPDVRLSRQELAALGRHREREMRAEERRKRRRELRERVSIPLEHFTPPSPSSRRMAAKLPTPPTASGDDDAPPQRIPGSFGLDDDDDDDDEDEEEDNDNDHDNATGTFQRGYNTPPSRPMSSSFTSAPTTPADRRRSDSPFTYSYVRDAASARNAGAVNPFQYMTAGPARPPPGFGAGTAAAASVGIGGMGTGFGRGVPVGMGSMGGMAGMGMGMSMGAPATGPRPGPAVAASPTTSPAAVRGLRRAAAAASAASTVHSRSARNSRRGSSSSSEEDSSEEETSSDEEVVTTPASPSRHRHRREPPPTVHNTRSRAKAVEQERGSSSHRSSRRQSVAPSEVDASPRRRARAGSVATSASTSKSKKTTTRSSSRATKGKSSGERSSNTSLSLLPGRRRKK